jgi:hypothetical protein
MGAGALVMLGSLLPWATVSSAFGQISLAGTEGDGKFTLGLGAAIIVGFVGGWVWLQGPAALGALGLSAYHVVDVSNNAAEVDSDFVRASVGWGLWLTFIAAIVAVVAAGMFWWARRQRP